MMWCGRELGVKAIASSAWEKVRAIAAPLFRKGKSERTPHPHGKCFEAWMAEVQRADQAQDGGSYQALPVLKAIAERRMPPGT